MTWTRASPHAPRPSRGCASRLRRHASSVLGASSRTDKCRRHVVIVLNIVRIPRLIVEIACQTREQPPMSAAEPRIRNG